MGLSESRAIFSARRHRWACISIVIGIVIVGLWPFDFWPENQVEWLPGENGIRFYGRGLISGLENSVAMASRSQMGHSLTVELWLKPDIKPQKNLPVFVTIYDQSSLNAITLAQWRSELIVRWQNLNTPLVFNEFGVAHVLGAGEKRLLTFVFDASATAIFVDGRLKRKHAADLMFSLYPQSIGWVLGNTPNGRSPWRGDVFAFAIYNRALSTDEVTGNFDAWMREGFPKVAAGGGLVRLFQFDERAGEIARSQIGRQDELRIRRLFAPLQQEILVTPWSDFQIKQSYFVDMVVNIVGFTPFGFFFAAWFAKSRGLSSRKASLLAVLLSAVLSLAIELIQAWIPSRDSQLMDVLMNTSGAALGSLVFVGLRGTRRQRLVMRK